MIGYYLPQYNWSVKFYKGMWCLFFRRPDHELASTPEQIAAIGQWANWCRRKFEEGT